jgi:UDP-glucose 4-epimerase
VGLVVASVSAMPLAARRTDGYVSRRRRMAPAGNINGTVNVLHACVRHGVQTVFYPTKPNEWLNTYSITKKAGEEFAQLYAQTRGLDVRVLRWLNAYGPRQKLYPIRKAVPVMILQALHDLDVEVWGTGDQPVDLIHTEDLARNTVQYTLADNIDSTVRDAGNTVRMT